MLWGSIEINGVKPNNDMDRWSMEDYNEKWIEMTLDCHFQAPHIDLGKYINFLNH